MRLSRKSPQIQLGDRFTKADDKRGKVWEVVYLWTAVDGIPHVRLAAGPTKSELRTLALPALTDTDFWVPVND